MRTILLGFAAAAMIGLSGPVLAEDGDNNRLDDAWADLTVNDESILTAAQFAALNTLAFQAAVTHICDGYELDPDKFGKALEATTSTGPANMSPDDAKKWESAVIFRLGAAYGIFLAEGNGSSNDFCDSAAEYRSDAANVWK